MAAPTPAAAPTWDRVELNSASVAYLDSQLTDLKTLRKTKFSIPSTD